MNKKLISRAVLEVIDAVEADFFCYNFPRTPPCGARGIYGQNLLSTSVRRTIYQTKPLGMREPKKLVVMIFDAIKSARLRFFLIYQGPNQSILPFSQP